MGVLEVDEYICDAYIWRNHYRNRPTSHNLQSDVVDLHLFAMKGRRCFELEHVMLIDHSSINAPSSVHTVESISYCLHIRAPNFWGELRVRDFLNRKRQCQWFTRSRWSISSSRAQSNAVLANLVFGSITNGTTFNFRGRSLGEWLKAQRQAIA